MRWPKDQFMLRGKVGGEVIIEFRPPYVATTLQRRQGDVYAETKCYITNGNYVNGDIKLKKHPNIKGSPAR